MKIDVHNHIGVDPAYMEDRTAKELIEEMEKAKVDKCIVFPFTTNPDTKEQNKVVNEAFKKYPDRLIGFFTMMPIILVSLVKLVWDYT